MSDNSPGTPAALQGRYQLGRILGTGGMGTVYDATQLSLGRRVAIKLPRPELATDPLVARRFRAEAIAGSRLEHPNIARVFDFDDTAGAAFIVMEYVPGTPLDQLVSERGPVGLGTAVELCAQILAAVGAAHAAGIIHADIKSANVLVDSAADGTQVARLIDFGLARFQSEPVLDEERSLSGTPDYLAPEVIQGGSPTIASDIYAVGVVLYELLTGTTPFQGGTSAQIMQRQVDDWVVPPSLRATEQDIPASTEDVVMRALAKDPEARFATAAAFATALRASTSVIFVPAPRSARAAVVTPFSVEATTRNWGPSELPLLDAARGSESGRVQRLRAAVERAVAGHDSDLIVTAYLDLVRGLIDGRQLTTAVAELEHALILLRPETLTSSTPHATWRLQLCLAALYSGLGDPVRARCAATIGQDDAIRASSRIGQDRAHDLLSRLARQRACNNP